MTDAERLLAAASSTYHPDLPLPLVLQYAAACMWDESRSQAPSRIAWTLAMVNGLVSPKGTKEA